MHCNFICGLSNVIIETFSDSVHQHNNDHFTAIIQVNLRWLTPPVKNWRILSVQSVTARMPLLTAASTFGLGRRCWSSPQQCYLRYCLRTVPSLMKVVYYYVKFCEIYDFRHIFKRNSFHRGSLFFTSVHFSTEFTVHRKPHFDA